MVQVYPKAKNPATLFWVRWKVFKEKFSKSQRPQTDSKSQLHRCCTYVCTYVLYICSWDWDQSETSGTLKTSLKTFHPTQNSVAGFFCLRVRLFHMCLKKYNMDQSRAKKTLATIFWVGWILSFQRSFLTKKTQVQRLATYVCTEYCRKNFLP